MSCAFQPAPSFTLAWTGQQTCQNLPKWLWTWSRLMRPGDLTLDDLGLKFFTTYGIDSWIGMPGLAAQRATVFRHSRKPMERVISPSPSVRWLSQMVPDGKLRIVVNLRDARAPDAPAGCPHGYQFLTVVETRGCWLGLRPLPLMIQK